MLAERVREGIREAGGIALEFPVHPIQETGKRPTAGLDRNLAYLGLVEVLFGYPLDGVVLTIGCDKTTPACLMAAATVNMPAIALSVGPMLNGWYKGERTGSGTIVWHARELLAAGEIDYQGFIKLVASSAPSTGYCNTMGTATTMNSLTEALGMSLPGSAAIPAPLRDRQECAYLTGKQIVEMVAADRKPSDILTREAFINAIRVNSAIGGSTNAPIHLNALARHIGVELSLDDWQTYGQDIPLLVNLQPAGEYLGEDYYRAGGVPAVVAELMRQGLIDESALTVNGKHARRQLSRRAHRRSRGDPAVRPAAEAEGRLHGPARQSVRFGDHEDQRDLRGLPRALSVATRTIRRRSKVARVVFDGPEDYHARIDDPALGIDDSTLLFMRGTGPIGYPGAAEVVNMRPPVDADQSGHSPPALHRRRPPVGHLGIAVDSERLAGSGGRRRPGAAANRRSRAHRSAPRRGEHSHQRGGAECAPPALQAGGRLSDSAAARHRGRRCSAQSSARPTPARCSNPRRSISASRRRSACRATIIEWAERQRLLTRGGS